MKILFFSHQAEFIYGGEVVTLEFMRELVARGVGVHFASPEGPYATRAAATGARCHVVGSRQFSRSLTQLPGIALSLARTRGELEAIAARERIQLLHATSLKAMAFAWSGSLPTIWHHHDILPNSVANSLWLRGLAARATRILAPSNATRDALLDAGVSEEKVRVLRNGFRLSDWKARPPRHGKIFRVGVVGEISHRKGTDRLEPLLRELSREQDLQFLVIGEGLSEPEFARDLERRLASRSVRFLGRRSRMKELYQEMDVLFVPSRQDPLPTVIVEAGLSGVPVVGARNGGIPEMIAEGKNGYLFDTEAEAAAAILKTREKWAALSRGARDFASGRYDITKLCVELLQIYEEAIHGA
ncbi:MAG: glycosyltransferase family 4 protein [Bdellovibrionota bacterium]